MKTTNGWWAPALATACTALLVSADAEAGGLKLTISDAVTARPLGDVAVELVQTRVSGRTDAHGALVLTDVAPGSQRLRLWREGYQALELAVQVGDQVDDPTPVAARLQPVTVRLNESVVVTPSREPVPAFDEPRSVSVVEAGDLDRRLPRTTPEALMELGGVWVQKTNHGGGSPFLRGLVGNHVLVLVDGIRLNNATFRYGPNQYLATVDPLTARRLEVVRGLGSVLYGSDALGGVVNVVTRRPELSPDGFQVSGSVASKLVSSDMEKTGRVELAAGGRRAAWRGGLTWRDYGHLRAGGGLGVEAPSGYAELNGDARGMVRLAPGQLFHVAYQHVHQDDVPRWDQVAQRGFRRYSFDPQVRQLGYAQLESSLSSRWIQGLKVTTSWHRSSETRVRQTNGSPIEITEKDVVDVWGFSADARSRLARGWTVVAGAEHYRDNVDSGRSDLDLDTGTSLPKRGLYPDGALARSSAAFLHSALEVGRVVLHGGGRLTHYAVSAADRTFGDLDLRSSAWVGSAAVLVKLTARHRLFAAVSQGFRAPNVDDVSTLGPFDFGIEVPSPDLLPERTVSYELGLKSRTSRAALVASVYRTNLSDLIDRVPEVFQGSTMYEGQRVYRRANVGRACVWGVEAEAEWQLLPALALFGGAAYTFGQQLSTGEPLRRIPPLNGLAGLRWDRGRLSWRGALMFAAMQDRLAAGDRADHRIAPGGTPGWQVVNVQAAYRLRSGTELVAGADNLFDEAYRVHGSGIDGPGRNAWMAIRHGF